MVSSSELIGQVHFQKKGRLVVFYYFHVLQKLMFLMLSMWTLIIRRISQRLTSIYTYANVPIMRR